MPAAGNGTWTLISGGGTIGAPNSPNTNVTNLAIGANIFQWETSSPPCPSTVDQVIITRVAEPTTADAGPDITVCNGSTTTITGNPITFGTSNWSFVTGPTTPSISFTGNIANISGMSQPGVYTFRYQITNPPCTPTVDEVNVEVINNPDQPSTINGAVNVCVGDIEIYSVANDPNTDNWNWSVSPGGPVINPTGSSASVEWTTAGAYVLDVIPQNACGTGPARSLLVRVEETLIADAGIDRIVCGQNTLLTGSPAGGVWSCVNCPSPGGVTPSGSFGIVSNMRPGVDYVFEYEVGAGGNCGVSTDLVTIRNERPIPGRLPAAA